MKARLPPTPVLLLALLVPLISMIPTWQGYSFQQPPEKVFMGFRYMAGDHYQYAAFMREGRDGVGLFMYNPFTTDPQKGVFLLPYFWLIGVLSRLAGDIVLWWNLFRILGGALYIIAFWWFAGSYFKSPGDRLLATGLFSIAGGLDWIVTLLRLGGMTRLAPIEHAFDFYWNWSTFGAMQVPNWIWPALFMICAAHASLGRQRFRDIAIFLLLPAVWFLHAYSGMVAYLTFGLLPLVPVVIAAAGPGPIPKQRVRDNLRVAAPALLSFLIVLAYLAWARNDVVFHQNSERGLTWTDSFSVWWYPLSYGLLLPLAWYGLKSMIGERSLRADLLLAWFAAAIILSTNSVYAGVKFQYLVFPPLVLLATQGLLFLRQTHASFRRFTSSGSGVAICVVLLCANAPVSLFKDQAAARDDKDIYMSTAEIEAMRWLEKQPDGAVLCMYHEGNRIPWLAGKRVFVGHWFMTPGLNDKMRVLSAFFAPDAPAEIKNRILERTGVSYVFTGPDEMNAGVSSAALPLTQIYSAGGYTIYRVDFQHPAR